MRELKQNADATGLASPPIFAPGYFDIGPKPDRPGLKAIVNAVTAAK